MLIAESRVATGQDKLALLCQQMEPALWSVVLKTPVTQLGARLESAQQETFRCQHEMLDQIAQKQTQFVAGIQLGSDYFKQKQQHHSRLAGLSALHKSFAKSLSREEFLRLGEKANPRLESVSKEEQWPHLLSATPKKIEDLAELSSLASRVEQLANSAKSQNSDVANRNSAVVKQLAEESNRKYFVACLAKSLSAIPMAGGNVAQAVKDLTKLWTSMQGLSGIPDKHDALFGLLINKLSKNTIGQLHEGIPTAAHLNSAFQAFTSSAHTVLEIFHQLSQISADGSEIVLSPNSVLPLKQRTYFLMSQLALQGKPFRPADLPILDSESQRTLLMQTAENMMADALSVLRGVEEDPHPEEGTLERVKGYIGLLGRKYSQLLGRYFEQVMGELETTTKNNGCSFRTNWRSMCDVRLMSEAELYSEFSAHEDQTEGRGWDEQDEPEETHVILDDDDEEG